MSFVPDSSRVYTNYGIMYYLCGPWGYTLVGVVNQADILAFCQSDLSSIGYFTGNQFIFNDEITETSDQTFRSTMANYQNTFNNQPNDWTADITSQSLSNGITLQYSSNSFSISGILNYDKFVYDLYHAVPSAQPSGGTVTFVNEVTFYIYNQFVNFCNLYQNLPIPYSPDSSRVYTDYGIMYYLGGPWGYTLVGVANQSDIINFLQTSLISIGYCSGTQFIFNDSSLLTQEQDELFRNTIANYKNTYDDLAPATWHPDEMSRVYTNGI